MHVNVIMGGQLDEQFAYLAACHVILYFALYIAFLFEMEI